MLKKINLALRGIMEFGIVAGLGYWGFKIGTTTIIKTVLAICIPLIGFGFWGLVDFHNAGKMSEIFRLIQELVISGFAAIVLYSTGQYTFGWILGLVSLVHHGLVYVSDDKLLKHQKLQ